MDDDDADSDRLEADSDAFLRCVGHRADGAADDEAVVSDGSSLP